MVLPGQLRVRRVRGGAEARRDVLAGAKHGDVLLLTYPTAASDRVDIDAGDACAEPRPLNQRGRSTEERVADVQAGEVILTMSVALPERLARRVGRFYGGMFRVPQARLRTIPDVLVGLTSVAAVRFVGKKALAGPATISEVSPADATVGAHVTIATSGIIKSESDLPALTVAFGKAVVERGGLVLTTTTSLGVLIECAVPLDAVGKVDVKVSAPTGKQASWPGFEVIPQISPGQNLQGGLGETVEIMTTGVVGLGKDLPGLSVMIAGEPADKALNANGNLQATVPANAPVGPKTITLTTPGGAAHAPFQVKP